MRRVLERIDAMHLKALEPEGEIGDADGQQRPDINAIGPNLEIFNPVVTVAGDKDISICAAIKSVIAVAAIKRIGTGTTGEDIFIVITGDAIVATATD